MISIIVPTFNEEKFIANILDSIYNFKLPENIVIEVLIIDAYSTDLTIEIVNKYIESYDNIKIIYNQFKFQNYALNLGIKNSIGDWILRLDAHSIYSKDYLLLSYKTAIDTKASNVGGIINTLPGDNSFQAKLVQAISTHPFGVGDSTFRTGIKEGEVDTVPFGFFPKSLFDKIGFFNEKLVRGEDYEFNSRIRKNNFKVWMNPNIKASYFNQKNLFLFYKKQILLEGPYNVLMWFLAPYSFTLRHLIPFIFFGGVILGFFLSLMSNFIMYLYLFILILYFCISIYAAIQQSIRYKTYNLFLFLPFLFFLFHFLYGFGVLFGFFKLLLNKFPGVNIHKS